VVSWVTEYVGDIESDLSVFHRVDIVDQLPIARYLALAPRLAAYQGALRARLAEQPAAPQGAAQATVRGVPLAAGAHGDTPPEVVARLKREALASRHGVDPASIEVVSTDVLLKELMT
jgi:hypothetical protein